MTYWGNLAGTHYSPLAQINTANVKSSASKMGPSDSRERAAAEAIPLVVDGIMYTHRAGARDRWRRWPSTPGRAACFGAINVSRKSPIRTKSTGRIAASRSLGNRVFFGTLDAFLVALDARTGANSGKSRSLTPCSGYSITAPPLPVKDIIITGIAGGEFGIHGFLEAHDQATGKILWRFNTVPQPGEAGHETWQGDSWKRGGAPTWLSGTYDTDLNHALLAGRQSGAGFNGDVRKGDNLYSCSVIALDPDTGKLKWHYQFTPNDTHDWDSTEDMVLVDRVWHGVNRKLLLHADRNGVFYVLDRTNGKFLAAQSVCARYLG